MSDKAINQRPTISIEKDMIKNEKELTITFVRDVIVEKGLVTHYHLKMVMEKETSRMPKFD